MRTCALLLLLSFCSMMMSQSASKAEGSSSIASAIKMLTIFNNDMQRGLQAASSADDGSPLLPYTTISYAQTIDGTIAPLLRTRLDISSKCSFQLLHSLRALHDAVLIGVNTLVFDKPRLTVRDPLPAADSSDSTNADMSAPLITSERQPRPVVIDSQLKFLEIPNSDIFLLDPIICTCILSGDERYALAERKLAELGGGSLLTCKQLEDPLSSSSGSGGHCDLRDAFMRLRQGFGLASILVEGGAGIIQSVLEAQLATRIVVTIKPSFFGGYRVLTAQLSSEVAIDCPVVSSIGGDIVVQGNLVKSTGSGCERRVVDFL